MTAQFAATARKRVVRLLILAVLVTGGMATIAPASAQPVCPDGKIWSGGEGRCVDLKDNLPDGAPQRPGTPAAAESGVAAGTPTGQSRANDATLRAGEASNGFALFSKGCPAGFDTRAADRETLFATCTESVGDVKASLTIHAEAFNDYSYAPPDNGGARWAEILPPGDYAVSQSVPPAYGGPATVICYQSDQYATANTRFDLATDVVSFVLLDLQPGEYWYCHSFLVAKPVAEITLYVRGCPENYDIYTKGPDELQAACTGSFEGTEFRLTHPTAGISLAQTSSFSAASFVAVPAGQVRVKESMPNGYGVPVVFCQVRGPQGQTTEQYDKFDVGNDASIGLGMDQFEFVACDFFQAPGGQPVIDGPTLQDQGIPLQLDPGAAASPAARPSPSVAPAAVQAGTVGLRLHGCPEGFDGIDASLDDLAQGCRTPLGGVDFTLQYAGLAPSHQTELDGAWTFTDVTGAVTVSEFPPVSGWLIRASCSQFRADSPTRAYLDAPVGQGSATWTLLPGEALDCDWYNFPAVTPTTATVTVRAHACPGGYDARGVSIYDLAAACPGVAAGVAFSLTPLNSSTQSGETDQDLGMKSWQDVPSGRLEIQERIPTGVNVIRIFCNQRKSAGGALGFAEVASTPLGTMTGQLLAGYDEYDCDWYNATLLGPTVPTPTATPAKGGGDGPPTIIQPTAGAGGPATDGADGPTTLTIAVFACPAAYDVLAADADPATECQTPASGTGVTSLGGVTGTLATKTAADDGTVVFPNLTPGAHLITVLSAQPLASAFILECSSNLSDFSALPFFPFALIGPDGAIRIDVRRGEQLSCTWYDVPA